MAKYRFDIGIFERFEKACKNDMYQPVVMLASKTGVPFVVKCSNKPDPARWCIIGPFFDATFLSLADLQRYVESKGMRAWTVEDDRKANTNFMNYCKSPVNIF